MIDDGHLLNLLFATSGPFITGAVMVDEIRRAPPPDSTPPRPGVVGYTQNRPPLPRSARPSNISGMGMPQSRLETRLHRHRLYRNFAGRVFTSFVKSMFLISFREYLDHFLASTALDLTALLQLSNMNK